jgi:hypothetical protein
MRHLAEADALQTGLLELAALALLEWSVEAGVLRFRIVSAAGSRRPAPYGAAQLTSAIEEAKVWADRNGIPTVYVAADAAQLENSAPAV